MKGPHQRPPVRNAGVPLEQASTAMVMVHGRGASAESILTLAPVLNVPGFAYLAPQAGDNTWYPQSFLAPIQNNQPGISSALQVIVDVLAGVSAAGTPVFLGCSDVDPHIPAERVRGTAAVMRGLGGEVTMRLYAGMGHVVNEDEITAVRKMMAELSTRGNDEGAAGRPHTVQHVVANRNEPDSLSLED